jgi:hypothetical protein
LDVVVDGGWTPVKAVVGTSIAHLDVAAATGAFTKQVKGKPGSRPVAAVVEVDHFGLSDYKGRVRTLVTTALDEEVEALDSYAALGKDSSHIAKDLKALPNGKWVVMQFSEKHFPEFHDGGERDLPCLWFGTDIAAVPQGSTKDTVAFRYRLLLLCYTRKPQL